MTVTPPPAPVFGHQPLVDEPLSGGDDAVARVVVCLRNLIPPSSATSNR